MQLTVSIAEFVETLNIAMPPKRAAAVRGGKPVQRSAAKRPAPAVEEEEDSEYRDRRERNNIAVKKSRAKSRARAQMTADKVAELQRENTELEGKIKVLSKELDLLKDLLVLQAGKKNHADSSKDAVTTSPSSAASADTCSAAADPDLINQDHGYVSPINRLRKTH